MHSIDFYVSVIDNYGDMGFALNFALTLHRKYPDLQIRFFSDDEGLFRKFLKGGVPAWMEHISLDSLRTENPVAPAKLICSFFDYRIPKEYLAAFSYEKTIVSFSYFLLHEGLESLHGTTYTLESGYDRVIHFVPSLLSGGGGVIINPEVMERTGEILKRWREEGRKEFMERVFTEIYEDFSPRSKWQMTQSLEKKWISVFAYKESLEEVLDVMEYAPDDVVFFIFWTEFSYLDGKKFGNIVWMPFLSLEEYGVFQSLCDANIVRGENSLCQGLISGRPVLWDIYKEKNGAHSEKIGDYLLFLGKQFPDVNWTEYARIMRGFNEWTNKGIIFSDFVSGHGEYEGIFREISEYVRGECDLIQKFEKIL